MATFVRQQQISDNTSLLSHSFSITTVTGANAVFVQTTAYGGPIASVTIGGVIMAQAGSPSTDRGSDGSILQSWYLANVIGGSAVTLLVTSNVANTCVGNVSEFSGMGSYIIPHYYGQDDFGANNASPTPGGMTASGSAQLAFWCTANFLGHTPTAYPGGYTALTASTTAGWWGAYTTAPATGVPTGTYVSSDDWNCIGIVFDYALTPLRTRRPRFGPKRQRRALAPLLSTPPTASLPASSTGSLTLTGSVGTTTLTDGFRPLIAITDDFSAQLSSWNTYPSGASVASNQLTFVGTTSYPTLASAYSYDLTSRAMLIKLDGISSGGSGLTGFIKLNDAGGTNYFAFEFYDDGSRFLTIFCDHVVANVSTSTDSGRQYNATTHAWLRIRENNGTIYFESSPDGITWTTMYSQVWTIPAVTTLYVGIGSGVSTGSQINPVIVSHLNLPPGSVWGYPMAAWRTAALAGNANILVTGDSISEGQGASVKTNRWVDLMLATLRTKYSISGGGVGYLPSYYGVQGPDSTWQPYTSRSGTIVNQTDLSLGDRTANMTSGATQTYTITGTSADIYLLAGTITYKVDAGSAVTIGPVTSQTVTRISLGASASHTLLITATASATELQGVVGYNGDESAGIRLYDSSHYGFIPQYFLDEPQTYTPVSADILIVALGINDFVTNDLTPTQLVGRLRTLIGQIRSAMNKSMSVLVVIEYSTSGTQTPAGGQSAWSVYQAAIANISTLDSSIYVVDWSGIGSYTGTNFSSDQTHPNDTGHSYLAGLMSSALGPITASASLTLTGSATGVGKAPATSGTLTLTGSATATVNAPATSGSLTLTGSATGTGKAPATSASLTLTGAATGTANAPASSATLVLTGAATAAAPETGTASLTLTGSATVPGTPVASAALVLTGSATAVGATTASGALTLTGSATATTNATAAGALTLTGSSTASVAASASAAMTLTGSATGQAPETGTAALTLTGSATVPGTLTPAASLTLTGSGTFGQPASASGSLTLAGSSTATANASATGALTLAGSASASVAAVASADLTLTGSGATQAPETGSGALTLTGSAAPSAPETGSATLTLTGSTPGTGFVTASGALTLAGSATAAVQAVASGALTLTGNAAGTAFPTAAGTLTLTGSASASAKPTAAAALTLTGSGAATPAATTANGSLTLTGSASASVAASATAALTLTGSATASGPATGSAALVLTGSVNTAVPATGAASLSLTGSASTVVVGVSGTLSLTGSSSGGAQASATAALSVAGAATGQAPIISSGTLDVEGNGNANPVVIAPGALTLTGSATAAVKATAAATLTLAGASIPSIASGSQSATLTLAGTVSAVVLPTAAAALSLTGSVTAKAAASASASLTLTGSAFTRPPTSLVSDDFEGSALKGLWTVSNTGTGRTVSVSGGFLNTTFTSAGTAGDDTGATANALHILQAASDSDFSVTIKGKIPTTYSGFGFWIADGTGNWLRADINGNTTGGQFLYVAKYIGGTFTALYTPAALAGGSLTTNVWLRLNRVGDTFTLLWSADGTSYTSAFSWTQALSVANVGMRFSSSFPVLTPTLVHQTQFGTTSNALSQNVTIPSVTATNGLVLSTTAYNGPVTSVTGGGVTWVEALNGGVAGGYHDTGPDLAYDQLWYGVNSTGSSTSVTINQSISGVVMGNISEWSGMGANVIGVLVGNDSENGGGAGGTIGTATASPSSGAIVGGGTKMLAITSMSDHDGVVPTGYPSGYTALTASTVTGWWGAYADAPASGSPTFTIPSNEWAAVTTVFDVNNSYAIDYFHVGSDATSSGSLTITGGAFSPLVATASGTLILAGAATAKAPATPAASLTLTGTATTYLTGNASLSLSGSVAAVAKPTSTASLSLSGVSVSSLSAIGVGSLTLIGSAADQAVFTAPANLSLSGTATSAKASPNATGTLSLAGGFSGPTVSANGSLSLNGSANLTSVGTATASAFLDISGSSAPSAVATASGSLTLSGSGAASASPAATGNLTLTGTGTAQISATTAAAALTLTGSATAAITTTASATLAITGSVAPSANTPGGSATMAIFAGASPTTPIQPAGSLSVSGNGAISGRIFAPASLSLLGSAAASVSMHALASLNLVGQGVGAIHLPSTAHLDLIGRSAIHPHTTSLATLQVVGTAAALVTIRDIILLVGDLSERRFSDNSLSDTRFQVGYLSESSVSGGDLSF